MCDEAVDDCLAALKFVTDWFVTIKMIKTFFPAFYTDENMLYFNEILVMLYSHVMDWVFLI